MIDGVSLESGRSFIASGVRPARTSVASLLAGDMPP